MTAPRRPRPDKAPPLTRAINIAALALATWVLIFLAAGVAWRVL